MGKKMFFPLAMVIFVVTGIGCSTSPYYIPAPKDAPTAIECPLCQGTGWTNQCPLCDGNGSYERMIRKIKTSTDSSGFGFATYKCGKCNGTGKVPYKVTCPKCKGSGKLWSSDDPNRGPTDAERRTKSFIDFLQRR